MTIVGIVKNERVQSDLRADVLGIAYVPIAQAPILWTKLSVRTRADSASIVPADSRRAAPSRFARRARRRAHGRRTARAQPVGHEGTGVADRHLRGHVGTPRRARPLRRRVAQRQPATPRDRHPHGARRAIERRPVDGGSTMRWRRLASGWASAWRLRVGLTRVTRSLLFEVSALDPSAFAIAAVTMMAIGVIAALIPASRATRVDPTTALRSE